MRAQCDFLLRECQAAPRKHSADDRCLLVTLLPCGVRCCAGLVSCSWRNMRWATVRHQQASTAGSSATGGAWQSLMAEPYGRALWHYTRGIHGLIRAYKARASALVTCRARTACDGTGNCACQEKRRYTRFDRMQRISGCGWDGRGGRWGSRYKLSINACILNSSEP